MLEKEHVLEFLYENNKNILFWIIILLQLILLLKVNNIERSYYSVNQSINNVQTLLWIVESPDNTQPVLQKGKLNPVETKTALLPAKPTGSIDVAYIEKGYSQMDNYYPVGKEIVYAMSEWVEQVGNTYKVQLLNTGWQITHITNGTWKGGKVFISWLTATNWQSNINVSFSDTLENYSKKAWSFVTLVIEN